MDTPEWWLDKIADSLDIELDYEAQQVLLKIIKEIQEDAMK